MNRRILAVADFRGAAKRRLPRFIFDFIDGGAGDETALRRNRDAFSNVEFVPRILALPALPALATTLWGERFEAPFGVAPMGLGELAWPGTDRALARAVAEAGVPLGVSMVASTDIADLAAIAGARAWLQVYAGVPDDVTEALLARAERAGVTTLVFTVDANHPGLRLRDRRNGFPADLRRLTAVLDLARHPGWALATLRAGMPEPVQLLHALGGVTGAARLPAILAAMARAPLGWDLLDRLRARWRGRLLVKGVLAPEDAVEAQRRGADGVIVSNHGGRQLAAAAAPLAMLPAIRAAVGAYYPLLLDSGVRSGEDVAAALALGADMVLLGRPFLFAAAALGPERGPALLMALLRQEVAGAFAQLGVADPAALRSGGFVRTPLFSAGSANT